jgi:F-type H+-transporting ATPase subunit c
MKKLTFLLLIAAAVLLVSSLVYAQTPDGAPAGNWAVPIGVGMGMGLSACLACLGQGKVAGSVAESLPRNPGARDGIQLALFIGLAFIESLVLFTFVLLFMRTS